MKVYISLSKVELDLDQAYEIFRESYTKAVGTSWDRQKFMRRAHNWEFYGDQTGFIAVRHQRSGLVKLTGVAGSIKGIFKGFKELQQKDWPIWGMMDLRLAKHLQKQGYVRPPAFLIKLLAKSIPKGVFGGVDIDIQSDGGIKFHYHDVGDATKYFVATPAYFKHILKDLLVHELDCS